MVAVHSLLAAAELHRHLVRLSEQRRVGGQVLSQQRERRLLLLVEVMVLVLRTGQRRGRHGHAAGGAGRGGGQRGRRGGSGLGGRPHLHLHDLLDQIQGGLSASVAVEAQRGGRTLQSTLT